MGVMIDGDLYRQAGVDVNSKYANFTVEDIELKKKIKILLRIKDEQTAVNRYEWSGIPFDLTSQEIERMLYYKYTLALFYLPQTDSFYLMPYALDGTIDFYGRFNQIHPIPYCEGSELDEKTLKAQSEFLTNLKLNVKHGVLIDENTSVEERVKMCALLYDYTKQRSQKGMPRCDLNDCLLDVMAEQIPFMNTCLLNGTGINMVEVPDASCAGNVKEASKTAKRAALRGEPLIAVVNGTMAKDINPLTKGTISKAEEYQMAFQSLDNIRLSMYGLANGGAFEKKAHMLESESNVNAQKDSAPYMDGLKCRQDFCLIINSIFGTHLWCDMPESIAGMDMNGDGIAHSESLNESSGIETSVEGGDE